MPTLKRACIAAITVLWILPASAHSWYTGLKNEAGEICCSGRDCVELADGDVTEVAGGYAIQSLQATVPYARMRPSPDGKWHACFWGGEIKCFFGPLPSF